MQRAERRNVRRMANNGEIKGGKSRKELRRKRGGKKVPIHGDTQHDRGNTAGRKEGLATCFCTCDDGEFFFSLSPSLIFFVFFFSRGTQGYFSFLFLSINILSFVVRYMVWRISD